MKPLRILLLSGYKDRPAPGLHVRAPRAGARWQASEAYFRRPPNVRRENVFWRPQPSWRRLSLPTGLTFLPSLDLLQKPCYPPHAGRPGPDERKMKREQPATCAPAI